MILGIDIGGTNTVWGVVNDTGKIVIRGKVPTTGWKSFQDYLDGLYESVRSEPGFQNIPIRGIGIGAPNGNFYTGQIEFAPNLPWKGVLPLAGEVESRFKARVFVTNDANAAAMGEIRYGAARGFRDFLMVTLGTGVGSGFICNGELVYGHDGLAGELGHTIAIRNGRICGCGRRGCLETYASATGIVQTAREFLESSSEESLLREIRTIHSSDIYRCALKGDELAIEIFNQTGEILGQSLADAVAITSPGLIVLYGGLAQAGPFIFEPTIQSFEKNLLKIYQNKIRIIPSGLSENDAAILGAAALAGAVN